MRFASLGSGSEGNALIAQSSGAGRPTTIMIDCGFGQKDLERRLARVDLGIDDLDAIFVTHEHGDHVGGVFRLGRKFKIPVYMTRGTFMNSADPLAELCPITFIQADVTVEFGDLRISPFTVPHDAREPVQYVIEDHRCKLGVLTDLGHLTPNLDIALEGLDAFILECNHDEDMLAKSQYPASLKRRISGPYGHLANGLAAQLLARLNSNQIETIVAAHLSSSNNTPDLARDYLANASARPSKEIGVAFQGEGFGWIER